jgi:hypothetical protein
MSVSHSNGPQVKRTGIVLTAAVLGISGAWVAADRFFDHRAKLKAAGVEALRSRFDDLHRPDSAAPQNKNTKRPMANTGVHIDGLPSRREIAADQGSEVSLTLEDQTLTNVTLTHLGQAIDDMKLPLDTAGIDPEFAKAVSEALQAQLKFAVSEAAVQRAILRMSAIIDGVALDTGLSLETGNLSALLSNTVVAYKQAEALVEAGKLYGTKTMAEYNALTPYQLAEIGKNVENRGKVDKADLGWAVFSDFQQYISSSLSQQNGAGLSWMQEQANNH